jgi:tRNA pseudouridine55 synthase
MTSDLISKKTTHIHHVKMQDYLILIDKPVNWTSFDVVRKVRNVGRFKKIGHAGTLDPFATGLLILGTGKKTRELTGISNDKKAYLAKITFGIQTDTYDITGNIVQKMPVADIDREKLKEVLHSFLGSSKQVAPMFSAKKRNGVRLYKYARKGKEVKREPHDIHVYEINQVELNELNLDIYIKCSKGTYIRTMAHDIGLKCGYGASLKELRRVSIGAFYLEDALSIEEFQTYWMSLN